MEDTIKSIIITKEQIKDAEYNLDRQYALQWHKNEYKTEYIPRPQWSKPELLEVAVNIYRKVA